MGFVGRGFTGYGKKKKPSFRGKFFAEESLFDLSPKKEGFLGEKLASE